MFVLPKIAPASNAITLKNDITSIAGAILADCGFYYNIKKGKNLVYF